MKNSMMIMSLCLTVMTSDRLFAQDTESRENLRQEHASWMQRVHWKGVNMLREKQLSLDCHEPNCEKVIFPSHLNIKEQSYHMKTATVRLRYGDDLFLVPPVEFQLTGNTNGVSFLFARGMIHVFRDQDNARIVPFGCCYIDSSAPARMLAPGLSVGNLGDVISWETRWKQFGVWQRGAIFRNVVVAIETGDDARNIALAVIKACCPEYDAKQHAEARNRKKP